MSHIFPSITSVPTPHTNQMILVAENGYNVLDLVRLCQIDGSELFLTVLLL
jgi:hypothetical protein